MLFRNSYLHPRVFDEQNILEGNRGARGQAVNTQETRGRRLYCGTAGGRAAGCTKGAKICDTKIREGRGRQPQSFKWTKVPSMRCLPQEVQGPPAKLLISGWQHLLTGVLAEVQSSQC